MWKRYIVKKLNTLNRLQVILNPDVAIIPSNIHHNHTSTHSKCCSSSLHVTVAAAAASLNMCTCVIWTQFYVDKTACAWAYIHPYTLTHTHTHTITNELACLHACATLISNRCLCVFGVRAYVCVRESEKLRRCCVHVQRIFNIGGHILRFFSLVLCAAVSLTLACTAPNMYIVSLISDIPSSLLHCVIAVLLLQLLLQQQHTHTHARTHTATVNHRTHTHTGYTEHTVVDCQCFCSLSLLPSSFRWFLFQCYSYPLSTYMYTLHNNFQFEVKCFYEKTYFSIVCIMIFPIQRVPFTIDCVYSDVSWEKWRKINERAHSSRNPKRNWTKIIWQKKNEQTTHENDKLHENVHFYMCFVSVCVCVCERVSECVYTRIHIHIQNRHYIFNGADTNRPVKIE